MGIRQQRLADEIRDNIANCFQGGKLRDPRLEGVSVTAVKISPDLQVATVYFRSLGTQPMGQVISGLERASSYFRRILAKNLDLRRVPELRYFYDETLERLSRIETLLARIKGEKASP